MTTLGKLITFFPFAVVLSAVGALWWLITAPSLLALLAVPAALYGLPLLAFRLHQRRFPLEEGGSHLVGPRYSAWFGAHQIQLIFLAVPALEALLRLIPGAFSLWLRLWGSRVGRAVYWTPQVEISDRSLLEIGDRVIFGHRSGAYAHLIKPTRKNLLLYVKRIKIGDDAFVGAGVVIAPGVEIAPGTFVPAGTHLYPRARAGEGAALRTDRSGDDAGEEATDVVNPEGGA